MNKSIYILKDEISLNKCKIGITTDLKKRLSQHSTSNPNYSLYYHFNCESKVAEKIEKSIKIFYKDKVISGSEWFAVNCKDIKMHLVSLLNINYSSSKLNAMLLQGKKIQELSYEEQEIFNFDIKDNDADFKRKNARLIFSQNFNLGLTKEFLPKDSIIPIGFPIDFNNCDINSQIYKKEFDNVYNRRIIHKDDHIEYFYYLLPLNSGNFFAYPIVRASLPYIDGDFSYNDKEKIIKDASEMGWETTFYHDWSWYWPNRTGLVVFNSNIDLTLLEIEWKNSLKKWVIENYKLLENYFCFDRHLQEEINKILYYIKEMINFPLYVKNFETLYNSYYMSLFFEKESKKGINGNKDSIKRMFRRNRAYRIIFRLWHASIKKNSLNKKTINISNNRIIGRRLSIKLFYIKVFEKRFSNDTKKINKFNIIKEKYLSDSISQDKFNDDVHLLIHDKS